MIIGVDPGLSGSLAVYDPDSMEIALINMPIIWIEMKTKGKNGKFKRRRKVNYTVLANFFKAAALKGIDEVWIEKVGGMPRDGVVSAFSFGESVGAVKMATAMVRLPCYEVTPQAWKKNMGLIGKDKEASVKLASDLFGKDLFPLVKDHNKADAALIACYGANH